MATEAGSVLTVADVVARVGDIPLARILVRPAPGTATEDDVVRWLEAPDKRLCELVNGVLVEKPMGAEESLLASYLGHLLWDHLKKHNLGRILGPDGMLRILPDLVRAPDVSFIHWERLPGRKLPAAKIPGVAPNLAVEVLSESNTRDEVRQKLKEYFLAGVEEVWVIQPRTETADVYTAPDVKRRIGKAGSLDGGKFFPGFKLPLKRLFDEAYDRTGEEP